MSGLEPAGILLLEALAIPRNKVLGEMLRALISQVSLLTLSAQPAPSPKVALRTSIGLVFCAQIPKSGAGKHWSYLGLKPCESEVSVVVFPAHRLPAVESKMWPTPHLRRAAELSPHQSRPRTGATLFEVHQLASTPSVTLCVTPTGFLCGV